MPVVTTQLKEMVRVFMPPYYLAPARLTRQIRTSCYVVRICLASAQAQVHTERTMKHKITDNTIHNGKTYAWAQQSPFGKLIIVANEDSRVRLVQLRGSKEYWPRPAEVVSKAPAPVRKIAVAFERYFAGDAHALDSLRVDLSCVKGEFQLTVIETLRRLVDPGDTMTYGELAAAAGRPGAARAVGYAMAHNPVPLIVPCHRVLASDGSLHGYGGGLKMKRKLLSIEGVDLAGKRGRR